MLWDVMLERNTFNQINEGSLRDQLKYIKHIVSRNQQLGFKASVPTIGPKKEKTEDGYRYSTRLRITNVRNYRSPDLAEEKFDHILRMIKKGAENKGWRVVGAGKNGADLIDKADQRIERPPFIVPVLDDMAIKNFLGGIYGRDPHFRVIHNTVETYVKTNFRKRTHTLLYGLPASCKTEMFLALKDFYEQDGNEHVLELDSTTTSKAGFESKIMKLAEDGKLPEILLLEEIEKHNPDNMLALLGMMDVRGRISRTHARQADYTKSAETKILVWATCNDDQTLKKFHKGALWSRFTRRLRCVRPNRELMRKILSREVEQMEGDQAWVDPAIEFGFDELNMRDPREIIGLLDGGDRLLDGSFQEDLRAIKEAEREEDESEMEALAAELPGI